MKQLVMTILKGRNKKTDMGDDKENKNKVKLEDIDVWADIGELSKSTKVSSEKIFKELYMSDYEGLDKAKAELSESEKNAYYKRMVQLAMTSNKPTTQPAPFDPFTSIFGSGVGAMGGTMGAATMSGESSSDRRSFDHPGMLKKMMEVVKDDPALLVAVLKDKDLAEWWSQEKEKDRILRERQAEKQRLIDLRQQALAKLTYDERKALGI